MKLTKINVAEAHIVSAVRLHFQCGHPASVYLLAPSAREILTTVGGKTGIPTLLHVLAETTGKPLKEFVAAAHESVNFLKHADRDPEVVLESITDMQVDIVLFIACHDFLRIAGGQPIEAQVYEVWYQAICWGKVADAPLRAQRPIRACIRFFKGIRSATRADQQKMGWAKLQEAANDPKLKMDIQREVILQAGSAPRVS